MPFDGLPNVQRLASPAEVQQPFWANALSPITSLRKTDADGKRQQREEQENEAEAGAQEQDEATTRFLKALQEKLSPKSAEEAAVTHALEACKNDHSVVLHYQRKRNTIQLQDNDTGELLYEWDESRWHAMLLETGLSLPCGLLTTRKG